MATSEPGTLQKISQALERHASGAFLAWAVLDFRALCQRDAASARISVPGTRTNAAIAAGVGFAAWFAFVRLFHLSLIGVPVV